MKLPTAIPPPTPLILLVDDEARIAFVVQEMLTSNGIDVILARDAHRALNELVRDVGRFDLLLTDVRLGDGPDGWDLARWARSIAPTLPVIYQTGDSAIHWRTEGVPESALLQKPFSEAQLISTIASQLLRIGTSREARPVHAALVWHVSTQTAVNPASRKPSCSQAVSEQASVS